MELTKKQMFHVCSQACDVKDFGKKVKK